MKRNVLLILFVLLAFNFSAQKVSSNTDAINTCVGAVNLFDNGEYQVQFTGKKAESGIQAYPSLQEIAGENQIWISFIASQAGELRFTAEKKTGFLQMVIFEQERDDICGEIQKGLAEIKRLHVKKDAAKVGLNYEIGGAILYVLKLRKGAKIQVLLATEEKDQGHVKIDWHFKPEVQVATKEKVIDRRFDDFAPTFSIKVRDKETKQPLVASIAIEDHKDLMGLYNGSDFFFNVDRNCKITIKCDVEGYFFDDREATVSAFEDSEVLIEMENISKGKSLKIEQIQFEPGTSTILKSSEAKLNRLRDFLALNSDMVVEVQGHVFALGPNSFAGQRISEARAKRVVKYLIDNGIDKSRLTAVGYGNTRPVYPEPQFSYEEQANRRVEILIK